MFKDYIEQITAKTKNVHQTHLEDEIIDFGKDGIQYVADVLKNIAEGSNRFTITTKWDGCIHPNTIILTENGNRTIYDIINSKSIIETKVLTHNFKNNQDEFVVADSPRVNNNGKIWVDVELENGEIIKTTSDHPFYTINRGWVAACELNEKDEIMQKK